MENSNKNIFVSFHHAKNEDHAKKIISLFKQWSYKDITVNRGNTVDEIDKDGKEFTDHQIREKIRDGFLRDVDVTIVIVGEDTTNRKHVDWEIRSTLHKFEGHRGGSIVVVDALCNLANCNDRRCTNYFCTDENCRHDKGAFCKGPRAKSWILDIPLIWEVDKKTNYTNLIADENTDPNQIARQWDKIHQSSFQHLPFRLRNSLFNNYDLEDNIEKRGHRDFDKQDYKHAVFPIVGYHEILKNPKILKLAIEQALNFKKRNQGKWDLQTRLQPQNYESSDRKVFHQVEP